MDMRDDERKPNDRRSRIILTNRDRIAKVLIGHFGRKSHRSLAREPTPFRGGRNRAFLPCHSDIKTV
jgi:hypothetical protein